MSDDDGMDEDGEPVHDIVIVGCCYTPEKGVDYEGPYLKYNEITRELAENLKGKQVHVEHDTETSDGEARPPVGKILDCYIDSGGNLMSILHITGDKSMSSMLPFGLTKGQDGKRFFNDLSLAHDVGFYTKSDPVVDRVHIKNEKPQEISIVRKGDREGTHIQDYYLLPYKTNKVTEPSKITVPTICQAFKTIPKNFQFTKVKAKG